MIAAIIMIVTVIVREKLVKSVVKNVTEIAEREEVSAKKENVHVRIISREQIELYLLSEMISLPTVETTDVMTTIIADVREILTGVTDVVIPVVAKPSKFGAFFL